MIIKLRKVKRTRVNRDCYECYLQIAAGEPSIYLFGAAEYGDKPYSIWIHPDCAHGSDINHKLEALEHKP